MKSQQYKAPLVRVVDDDAAMLKSWKFLIEGEGWTVKEYSSALEFLTQDDPYIVGCLVLDVRMPKMTGIELQKEMKARGNDLPIIFVSAHGDIDMAVQSMKDGAVDFLPKPVQLERLLGAIERAVEYDGKRREEQEEIRTLKAAFNHLTPREKIIAKMIAQGSLNKQIAFELDISDKTVQSHRGSLTKKLGARNASDITKLLMKIKEI